MDASSEEGSHSTGMLSRKISMSKGLFKDTSYKRISKTGHFFKRKDAFQEKIVLMKKLF